MAHPAHTSEPLYPISIYLATNEHLVLGCMSETDALETMTRLRDASSIGTYVAIEVGLLYFSY